MAVTRGIKRQIRDWEANKTPLEERECFDEAVIDDRRFVVAHNDEIARQSKHTRRLRMAEATSYIKWRIARTTGQHDGTTYPATGKVLTHQETLLHLHDYLRDRNLTKFYEVYLVDKGHVAWRPNNESRLWEREIDGNLLLETTNRTLSPEEVVS